MGQGSHPDIVERVWNILGAALPRDSRCLVYGTPALVQPSGGILLAFCLGTQYCLRLNPADMEQAIRLGAQTVMKWSSNKIMDARETLGPDWIFGHWLAEEVGWITATYNRYSNPPV